MPASKCSTTQKRILYFVHIYGLSMRYTTPVFLSAEITTHFVYKIKKEYERTVLKTRKTYTNTGIHHYLFAINKVF